ncbi:MAG: ubiquinol-cytochrome c reductase iron-sulfur subunit [bacterium]|nr:ubiquinol-cytochrome c reductase iron-sulfur subunit [bacterium]
MTDKDNSKSSKDPNMNRRDFLEKTAIGSLIGAGTMAFLGTINLPLPKVLNEPPSVFKIGFSADYQINTYKLIPERSVFILRSSEGMRALSAICTHLGCIVKQLPDGFSCPCHGSKFDTDGNVLGGPAPKGLEWLKVDMSPDGQLTVDLNSKVDKDNVYSI